jgi:hypothetical protein
MPYCPHCGNETEQFITVASPVADAVDRDVEIARINAERDIEVAKIAARQDRDWNETRVEVAEIEAVAEVESAEATAEIIGEVLAAETEPEAPADPIIIDAPEAIASDEPEDAPPETEGSPPPESKRKAGLGMW